MNSQAPLSDAELQKMIKAIFQVTKETRVRFYQNPKVFAAFSDTGCEITEKGIVKFPSELVRSSIDSVAKGKKDLKDIIGADLPKILANHKPEPLPEALRDRLNAIAIKHKV